MDGDANAGNGDRAFAHHGVFILQAAVSRDH